MIIKPGETRKQFYEKRLVDKKQELNTVLNQLGRALSDVEQLKLNRQAEDILCEIDNLENEISKLGSSTSIPNKNNIECKLEKSFQKIDYSYQFNMKLHRKELLK